MKSTRVIGHEQAEDFLEHYGVLGMKWGVRKDPPPMSKTRQDFDAAKKAKKQAKKEFNKAMSTAMRNPLNLVTEKGNKKYAIASKAAAKSYGKDSQYKKVKRERLAKISKETDKAYSRMSAGEKVFWGPGTAKFAAKLVVDNNIPYDDAIKRSKKSVLLISAAILAANGAYVLASQSR